MIRIFSLLILLVSPILRAESGLKILVVVGSGGTDDYTKEFTEIGELWKRAATKGEAAIEILGLGEATDGAPTDAERLKQQLAAEKSPELWLVFIGHGTFDQREVKFNFRGPDVTDRELATWVDTYQGRLAVINAASASGSFVRSLSKPGRIVITATKNEGEQSYARFGRYFAEAVGGIDGGDLDNDDQVSLLEAWVHASRRVAEFYKSEGRIATEHALLDDNGDQLGSRSEWFEGTTPKQTASPEADPDGDFAAQKILVRNAFERRLSSEQRERRDGLERLVVDLRRSKAKFAEADYYSKLEALLLELARLYDSVAPVDS
ncbi:MAG: hypothetical protein B9S36_06740 [Verrucomicrobiia bacterium Tous-C2TDCM]|nr:MAG: hypothetical protein B9S36_06740 [Verrucomicrobiae bacterium Tous-C2TDCM]